MRVCDYCGNNIAEGRLKIFPNTNLCSAKCVNEIKDSYTVINHFSFSHNQIIYLYPLE